MGGSTGVPTFQEVWPHIGGPPRPVQATLKKLYRTGMPPGLRIPSGRARPSSFVAHAWHHTWPDSFITTSPGTTEEIEIATNDLARTWGYRMSELESWWNTGSRHSSSGGSSS
jgi:hypothetical protein